MAKKEDNRDVFEKALDYVGPAATTAAGAYVAGKLGRKIGKGQAERYIKKHGNEMTADDKAFYRKFARRDLPAAYGLHGALGGFLLGDAAVGNVDRRLAAQKRRK